MARKVNLFYIEKESYSLDEHSFNVMHRRLLKPDNCCAVFYFGKSRTVSKTRALKAARVFCKQMNTYYPTKVNIF